jgi:hypothetical protein
LDVKFKQTFQSGFELHMPRGKEMIASRVLKACLILPRKQNLRGRNMNTKTKFGIGTLFLAIFLVSIAVVPTASADIISSSDEEISVSEN